MPAFETFGLPIVEDACEALGARYADGGAVGGRGHPSVFGFYANKQLTTGEGGIVTLRDRASSSGSTPSATRVARPTWTGSTTIASASTTGCRTSPARSAWRSSSASTRCLRDRAAGGGAVPLGARGPGGADAALSGRRRRPPRLVRVRGATAARARPRRVRAGARAARDPEQAVLPGGPPDELLPRDVRAPPGRVPGVRGRRRALDRAAVLPGDDRRPGAAGRGRARRGSARHAPRTARDMRV